MLSFNEIEKCFPDGALTDDSTGKISVSAQWLHDFANAIAAMEREACAKECEEWMAAVKNVGSHKHKDGEIYAYRNAATAIRMRTIQN